MPTLARHSVARAPFLRLLPVAAAAALSIPAHAGLPVTLTASDAADFGGFGTAVAIAGDTAIVGARNLADPVLPGAGAAYVFVRSGSSWVLQQKLTASDAAASDNFGVSVAISGDTVIIGARGDDDDGSLSGSAYIFVRSGAAWSQQAKLTASDAATGDGFGLWVSISGDTAIVCSPLDDDAGISSGSAYVLVRNGAAWTQQAKLTASDAAPGDLFGQSAALSGDTAVIGAWDDDDDGEESGSAYVFVRSGASWSQQQKLTASDAAPGDRFGIRVAVQGDTAIIGADADDDGGAESGSAYVFVRNGAAWSQQAKLTASDGAPGDRFGFGVAVSRDTAIVGAYLDDNAGGTDAGGAYLFRRSGVSWTEQAKLAAPNGVDDGMFGWAVGMTCGAAIVGAPRNADPIPNSGSAFVFALDACLGDANGDGAINFTDLNMVLSSFGMTGPDLPGDVDCSGGVNFTDLNIVLSGFGTTCPD